MKILKLLNTLMSILVLSSVGYIVADRMIPVVAFMEGTVVDRTVTHTTLHVRGYKINPCALVKQSWSVLYYSRDGELTESSGGLEFIKDKTPDNTRPASVMDMQNFGLWRVEIPMDATGVLITVEHLCKTDFTPRLTKALEQKL
jgi:hypothetical protein